MIVPANQVTHISTASEMNDKCDSENVRVIQPGTNSVIASETNCHKDSIEVSAFLENSEKGRNTRRAGHLKDNTTVGTPDSAELNDALEKTCCEFRLVSLPVVLGRNRTLKQWKTYVRN